MSEPVALPPGLEPGTITYEELQLAARNHSLPLESLRYALTPVGLHYLLVHYDVPAVDPDLWSLSIGGRVREPMTLTMADLRARPVRSVVVTLECAGNGRALLSPRPVSHPWLTGGVGTAEWTGIPLRGLLDEVGLLDDAVEVVFRGLDHGVEGGVEQDYARSLSLDAIGDDVLLAFDMNGHPLPPQHGFPLRLVVPGWYGMASVKWLASIDAVAAPFEGYQMTQSYRVRHDPDEPGVPVTRIMPRALMIPPGFPDFLTRRRTVPLAGWLLEGKAWSGQAPITGVQVSDDDGGTWTEAELDELPRSVWTWRGWRYHWEPNGPGDVVLCCRARDAAGNSQPLQPVWNLGGYANNAVQRVSVTVSV
jgi:DMSO/TMAO reductase YedYZ molybdopterin-dependent catalytic subunit